MTTNRPPMTVWLAFDAAACFERDEDCGASDFKNHHHHVGPYVNLKQFMAEVEERAYEQSITTSRAMLELAKEIEEGKA